MILQPETHINIPVNVRMQGFLRLQCIRPNGRVRVDTKFFPNKILTNGRNNMRDQATWLTHCHVGTDSTIPSAGDTQLYGFVVATSTIVSDLTGAQGTAPYYGWRRKTFRYNVGAGHGGKILSEAGIGWGAVGSVLISRALIIDPITQLPTSVTPLADEILDVTYELRYYPPLTDVLNSVMLLGVNYDTITRAALVTGGIWSENIGNSIVARNAYNTYWSAYDGVLGDITQGPNGLVDDIDTSSNVYNKAYVNNSYQTSMVAPCGPLGWNLGAGIRSIRFYTTAGAFQTQFSANPGGTTVPKNTSRIITLGWTLGWTEFVP